MNKTALDSLRILIKFIHFQINNNKKNYKYHVVHVYDVFNQHLESVLK